MKELTLPAAAENIEKAVEFVNSQLEAAGCPPKTMIQIDVAIDELIMPTEKIQVMRPSALRLQKSRR